ncbi:hypothetical protein OH77DRAFT_246736 [Trametes cingulata]|nr:hypothetical protein OH77DRAFT_246736 [Trametes cingulata]
MRLAILSAKPRVASTSHPSVVQQLRIARRYSESSSTKPSDTGSRSSISLILAGALVGVGAIGAAGMSYSPSVGACIAIKANDRPGYAWYHLSGTKRMVDTARKAKEIYEEQKAAAIEKRDAGREKAAVVTEAAKEKAAGLALRWRHRARAHGTQEQQAVSSVLRCASILERRVLTLL